jgi:hypothetical protein
MTWRNINSCVFGLHYTLPKPRHPSSLQYFNTSLRFEDRLDGASNILSWKVRVTLLLKENDLLYIVKDVVSLPTDPQ